MAKYLDSLRSLEKMAEPRFFRDCFCCEDGVTERTEDLLDKAGDLVAGAAGSRRSMGGWAVSSDCGACEGVGGARLAEGWSVE